jgi:hypothetical protein
LVTNELYIAVGIPMLFNAALLGLVIAYINARIGKVESKVDAIDKRFDDMRDLWRAKLRRVEGVLVARFEP